MYLLVLRPLCWDKERRPWSVELNGLRFAPSVYFRRNPQKTSGLVRWRPYWQSGSGVGAFDWKPTKTGASRWTVDEARAHYSGPKKGLGSTTLCWVPAWASVDRGRACIVVLCRARKESLLSMTIAAISVVPAPNRWTRITVRGPQEWPSLRALWSGLWAPKLQQLSAYVRGCPTCVGTKWFKASVYRAKGAGRRRPSPSNVKQTVLWYA